MRGGGCRPHPDGGAAEVARGRPRPGGCTPRRGCSGCGTPRVMSSGRGEGERGNRPRASVGNNSGAGGKHSGRLTKPDGRRSGLPGNTNCKKGGRRPERHCEKKVTKREAGKGHTAGRVAEHQDAAETALEPATSTGAEGSFAELDVVYFAISWRCWND